MAGALESHWFWRITMERNLVVVFILIGWKFGKSVIQCSHKIFSLANLKNNVNGIGFRNVIYVYTCFAFPFCLICLKKKCLWFRMQNADGCDTKELLQNRCCQKLQSKRYFCLIYLISFGRLGFCFCNCPLSNGTLFHRYLPESKWR